MGSSDNSLTISHALDIPSPLQKVTFSQFSFLSQSPPKSLIEVSHLCDLHCLSLTFLFYQAALEDAR